MRIVEDIEFNKLIPFSLSNRFNELLNMLSMFRDILEDVGYFLSDSKHLYLPLFIMGKLEVFLEFDFTDDDVIKLTFGELSEKLSKLNNKFAETMSKVMLDGVKDDDLCMNVFYDTSRQLDCIDVRTFSDKWTSEVAKNKLLGISNKSREEKRVVSVVKNGVKKFGVVEFVYNTHRKHTFEIILAIVCDFDEFNSEDVMEMYKTKHSYYAGVICVDFSDSYMSVVSRSKNLFGVFSDVELEVL